MIAAIYTRVSTDEQRREGHSLDAQKRLCREQADSEDYDVPDEFVYPEARSGAKSDRPEYQRLLADAASGKFQAVYVWKFDRLGRDAEELLRARRMLEAADVRLVSVTEGEEDSNLVYG
ncbi:MAG: recombinase family protein, partial [Vicinamibacteria bacterium]